MAAADAPRPAPPPARAHPARWAVMYAAAVAGAVLVAWAALEVGATLQTADHGSSAREPADDVVWRFLLALATIAAATLATGRLLERAGQPRVVGEILGGVLLGPTALGAVAPGVTGALFTPEVMELVQQLGLLGVVLFMLLVGLELDLGHLRRRGRLVLVVSHASIAVPFALGLLLALLLYSELAAERAAFAPFALFLGLSLSVTAFPVLAAILSAKGLRREPIGLVALACAAIDDVTAWCLLLVVVALAGRQAASGVVGTILALAAFVVLMLTVGRRLLAAAARAVERRPDAAATLAVVIFVAALLSAMATERIGLHVVFGAFLLGAALPRSGVVREAGVRLEHVAALCLPLFFAVSGMRTDFGGVVSEPGHLLLAALILVVAIAGKLGAAGLAARAMGLPWRDAASLGVLMNCRGLTELVVLNVGLELGVISQSVFSMLVLMTLVTTAMTAPLLSLVRRAP